MTSAASGAPRVVAIGGGHGTAATLAAARRYAGSVTAVVSVADDGGSSGRLRHALGIPPPGDLRRCLVALGDPDSVWVEAFEHRFPAGELAGHALGNLVIAGLASTTGNFVAALEEAGRLLGIEGRGRVLPATVEPVVLMAEVNGGAVEGQVAAENAGPIACISMRPADPEPSKEAIAAIEAADQVVVGPGSLFTSVLAVVAVPAIRTALATAQARKVYVCNLRPSRETEGFDVASHVAALLAHGLEPDTVVFDPATMPLGTLDVDVELIAAKVARPDGLAHDPARLAAVLADLVG